MLRAYAKNRHQQGSGTRNGPAITLADYIFGLARYQDAIQLILFLFFAKTAIIAYSRSAI